MSKTLISDYLMEKQKGLCTALGIRKNKYRGKTNVTFLF